ncbi:MAG: hypothetical protein GTO48_10290 [Xanthomonadales bacterium]|nr:hypothetical protein [Xanthomonadales bacterium]NIO15185.1 hypothetical protein [Xanthomonadales bacterium]NIP77370.1 hypothetical protein [Xanthomonadales bacterium]NIT08840.1 hypothetical protein [Xanthomonadales bacterium]
MRPVKDSTSYPLSADVTRRVARYLNVFRLFIGLALTLSFLLGTLVQGAVIRSPTIALVTLVSYVGLGVTLLAASGRKRANPHHLARAGLWVDTLLLSLVLVIFGGYESGLGVLLVFVSATAAILLPLRIALLIASLASLALVGEAFLEELLYGATPANIFGAGVYGLTNLITALLAHQLAIRARDYRLIAERQQRTLTRLEQINELIIRRMSSGVLALDRNDEIQMMNESAWFLLGNPAAERRALADVAPELLAGLNAWREHRRPEHEPLTLQASQAQIIPRFVALPEDGEARVLVFLDDNDVIARRAIERSATELAELSGSIAHEIRNPLAAISHAAQLLDETAELPAEERRLVGMIHGQARRMNGIVESILQLSRRERSRPELLDIRPWLEDLAEEFRSTLSRDAADITLAAEPGALWVMFDRGQLHQALWKLLENAVDHAGGDNPAPRVALRLQNEHNTGHCVISVEDNGPGIPPQNLGNIFEPFFTTRPQGAGLGLYVARQLCEANQAELTVDSTASSGARFHVRLATAGDAEAADPNMQLQSA